MFASGDGAYSLMRHVSSPKSLYPKEVIADSPIFQAGEYLGMYMIIGISMMPDVHGKAPEVGNVWK